MIFSSKTPRDLNRDPEPFLDERGSRWISPVTFQPRTFTYSPRPEFDHVQHNEPNPILVDLRHNGEPDEGRAHYAADLALGGESWRYWMKRVPQSRIDHARRVLTRLANLTKEN